MALNKPLYPASYLSKEIVDAFPPGFTIRPFEKGDFHKGWLECLKDLTFMGNVTEAEFNERYDEIDTNGNGPYYYVVLEYEGRIVGNGIVVAERKFIHNRSIVGHIEEVCIAKPHQGKGLGLLMLKALNCVAEAAGCTKTILNCSPEKEKFYNKCGYTESGMEMVHYISDFRTPPNSP